MPHPAEAALPAAVRQQRIVEWVQRDGYVRVASLAAHFGISQMSARRDLEALSQIGGIGAAKLERYGAGLLAVLKS